MTDLLSQVTPLSRGLIWIPKSDLVPGHSYYRDVDYLLNGLLTATLKNSPLSNGHVLVGENFGKTFYVLVVLKPNDRELESFFKLIKTELNEENEILVIDEAESFAQIQKQVPSEIKSKFRAIK